MQVQCSKLKGFLKHTTYAVADVPAAIGHR